MAIRAIKLVTREEMIGEIISNMNGDVVMESPVVLLMTERGFNFVPYMMYVEEKQFTFLAKDIITPPVQVGEELENAYRKQFGSGIELVTASSQLLHS